MYTYRTIPWNNTMHINSKQWDLHAKPTPVQPMLKPMASSHNTHMRLQARDQGD
jgi:hypothetical protein